MTTSTKPLRRGKRAPDALMTSSSRDGSEEDNFDELSEDGRTANIAAPIPRQPHHAPSHLKRSVSPKVSLTNPTPSTTATPVPAARRLAQAAEDSGVDSPTYDGDVESSATINVDAGVLPSSAAPPAAGSSSDTDDAQRQRLVGGRPKPGQEDRSTSSWSAEEIQAYVKGFLKRDIPQDRPVRVYADGVYDIFHFGHALQLRQAKLSFPSVHLLVGVCSAALCAQHKAIPVLSDWERAEGVRHCRWVDEVVEDAPWVVDQAFLDKHQIDFVAHDGEPYVAAGHDDVYAYVKEQGRFIPTRRTNGISTSELLSRIVRDYRKGQFDAKLEKIGAPELRSAAPSRRGSDTEGDRARGA